MKTDLEQLLQDKRAEIIEAAARNGANDIRVFGSIVRGDAQDESDIDFLVEFEKGRSALDEVGLIEELEQLLGRKVHVVTPGALHRVIRDKVMSQAIPL